MRFSAARYQSAPILRRAGVRQIGTGKLRVTMDDVYFANLGTQPSYLILVQRRRLGSAMQDFSLKMPNRCPKTQKRQKATRQRRTQYLVGDGFTKRAVPNQGCFRNERDFC